MKKYVIFRDGEPLHAKHYDKNEAIGKMNKFSRIFPDSEYKLHLIEKTYTIFDA